MRKNKVVTFILILMLLAGLSLLLYPTVSDYWNSMHQSRAIAAYTSAVEELDTSTYDELWEKARKYNERLFQDNRGLFLPEEEREEYEALLNVSGNGVMGYIEIPSIQCALPIYHGTDEAVLQIAIGHIEGSSLPVGGENTHCVVSGHRGLPSAKLFTNLDQIREGDIFLLKILNETLTYEVDQILTVLPDEVEALKMEKGKDLCTLVTCTPYGINSHRLLVRGHRIPNREEPAEEEQPTVEDSGNKTVLFAACTGAVLVLLALVWILAHKRKRWKEKGRDGT